MKKHYRLVRDLLDNQLIDGSKRNLGKIDGIVVRLSRGNQPRVTHLESGALVLARRLGPRWERLVAFMTRHFGVRRNPVFRVEWSKVSSAGKDVRIDVDGANSDAYAWERWLDQHVMGKVPFGRGDDRE
jgi:hypothetical protein